MKIRKKKLITTMSLILTSLTFIGTPLAQVKECSEVTNAQVKEDVENDFLKTFPRFLSGLDKVGTSKPELFWQAIQRGQDTDNKLISIPFTAKGPKGKIDFIGIYSCGTGSVEYSLEPE
ncbi:YebF family protein [Ewingella americana]|uniref:YebF family protein n=1 Tax=Ewingella americana TaxID=41202 RepID=UPI0012ADC58B|nr:YebF family protein [Ewingella americana]MRT02429.1 hypothetical protein [Ewingella americana]